MFIKFELEEAREPVWINVSQISSVNGNVIKMANCDILTVKEGHIHELLAIIAPKEKSVKDNQPKTELLELFEKLHKLTGGKGKPVFSLGREKKLNDLITKHRMTKEDLIKAATNIGRDKFLQGDNDGNGGKGKRYGDVDYLLRPDKAAKYADLDIKEEKKKMF